MRIGIVRKSQRREGASGGKDRENSIQEDVPAADMSTDQPLLLVLYMIDSCLQFFLVPLPLLLMFSLQFNHPLLQFPNGCHLLLITDFIL